MRALVLESYGSPFKLTEMARPIPGVGQFLVRIKASGVNPLDTKIRSGNAAHALDMSPSRSPVRAVQMSLRLAPSLKKRSSKA
jgi:NADPH2:quinone reductase